MAATVVSRPLAKPITPKRDRSGSSAAVDRFLQDSRRRSCSFVNLSPTALQELTETARRHHLVLTSCVEQNVGTVARLEWPNRAVDAPAAVVADELVCPRCAIQQGKQTHPTSWRDGRTVQLGLCAACSVPASPPSVMSPANVMRQPSTHETPTLPGSSYESPHALLSILLPDGHPPEPPRTTLRVATGQAYDVYDVQLPDRSSSGRSSPEPAAPPVAAGMLRAGGSSSTCLAAPSPRRASPGMAGGMASSSSAVSFASSVSFAPRSDTVSKARPGGPAVLLPRLPSFATQTLVNGVFEAVSDSRDRPELTEDGTGGVYLIRSCSPVAEGEGLPSPVAVFKPSDEEAGSHNNPRGLDGEEHIMREGFRPGGGAARELVAYQLDRGFAGVPKTAVDKLLLRTRTGTRLSEQTGSIQQFVESHGDASEYRFDGSEFSLRASERIALQDLRLFNCDRHEGNVLVCSPKPEDASSSKDASSSTLEGAKLELVPIDHAFILPSFGYFREAELVWRYWLSSNIPFGAEALAYVASLDVEADVAVARQAGLSDASCATLRTCTMLLKAALLGEGRAAAAPASEPEAEPEPEPEPVVEGAAAGVVEGAAAGVAKASMKGDAAEPYNGADSVMAPDLCRVKSDPGGGGVTPKALAAMLMRGVYDEPSPLERLCARALGVADEELAHDTALTDFVVARRPEAGGEDFAPPPEFYTRFAALLEETYGQDTYQETYGPTRGADAAAAGPADVD